MNYAAVGPYIIPNAPPPRCRVGDRCLIVGGVEKANLGRVVRVIAVADYPHTPMWHVRPDSGAGLMGDFQCNHQSSHGPFSEVAYPDVFLWPIRPDALDEGESSGVKRKRGQPRKQPVASESRDKELVTIERHVKEPSDG